ncbi:MAG: DUF1150 family protein [Alphaproteobacteria bacterium]|nr:MAG: DUF1150 family protein [Alphaproteobacteria bacterium]
MMTSYEFLKNMTPEMFANFGGNAVVYLKPFTGPGGSGFVIHAANGEKLAIVDSLEAALVQAYHNDLAVTRLH